MENKGSQLRIGKSAGAKLSIVVAIGVAALLLVTSGCDRPKNDRITASTEAPRSLNAREANSKKI